MTEPRTLLPLSLLDSLAGRQAARLENSKRGRHGIGCQSQILGILQDFPWLLGLPLVYRLPLFREEEKQSSTKRNYMLCRRFLLGMMSAESSEVEKERDLRKIRRNTRQKTENHTCIKWIEDVVMDMRIIGSNKIKTQTLQDRGVGRGMSIQTGLWWSWIGRLIQLRCHGGGASKLCVLALQHMQLIFINKKSK